jgi:sortase (surface protein transpeptidase)
MRVHDLRHSFATMATSIGEDIRTIKDVLGHTTITTTEIYAHTTNSAARKTANNVAAAILGNDKPAPAPDTTPPTAPAVAPVAIPVANIGIGNIPANDHAGPYTLRVLPEAARA